MLSGFTIERIQESNSHNLLSKKNYRTLKDGFPTVPKNTLLAVVFFSPK